MAAFTSFFVLVMLLAIGLTIITFNVVYDPLIDVMNPFISAGSVSKQFVTYWNFVLGVWVATPIFAVISITLWAVVRAIERRQMDGGQ